MPGQLTDRRIDMLLGALCVLLILVGFAIGRIAVDDSTPTLKPAPVELREPEDLTAIVVPSPIAIPGRLPR